MRKKPWAKSTSFHCTGVASEKMDGRPWKTGMPVMRIRTGLKPNGTVALHLAAWYENSAEEHMRHTVSLMPLHGVAVSDPSMHWLQGTHV